VADAASKKKHRDREAAASSSGGGGGGGGGSSGGGSSGGGGGGGGSPDDAAVALESVRTGLHDLTGPNGECADDDDGVPVDWRASNTTTTTEPAGGAAAGSGGGDVAAGARPIWLLRMCDTRDAAASAALVIYPSAALPHIPPLPPFTPDGAVDGDAEALRSVLPRDAPCGFQPFAAWLAGVCGDRSRTWAACVTVHQRAAIAPLLPGQDPHAPRLTAALPTVRVEAIYEIAAAATAAAAAAAP